MSAGDLLRASPSPKCCVQVLAPSAGNVTLFGNRLFADVIGTGSSWSRVRPTQ